MDGRFLDWQAVARRRSGSWADRPIIYRQEVDSTNTLAASLIPDRAPPGTAIVAEHQSAGRGRLSRRWIAAPHSALTFTTVLGPLVPSWTAPMVSGLAVVHALARLGLIATLKWPNDVLLADRKCAGILIESRMVAGTPWLLAGIGINVQSVDPSLALATYLNAHTPTPISREDLLVALLEQLEIWSSQARVASTAVRSAWQSCLLTIGQQVTVQAPGERFLGVATGITDDGALVVALANGDIRTVRAGDVTLSGSHLG